MVRLIFLGNSGCFFLMNCLMFVVMFRMFFLLICDIFNMMVGLLLKLVFIWLFLKLLIMVLRLVIWICVLLVFVSMMMFLNLELMQVWFMECSRILLLLVLRVFLGMLSDEWCIVLVICWSVRLQCCNCFLEILIEILQGFVKLILI